MDTKVIAWPTERTRNWETFHDVCAETFGFPDYYGRNMNAWIDCMTYLDEPDTRVSVAKGGLVVIRVEEAEKFASRWAIMLLRQRGENGQAHQLVLGGLVGQFQATAPETYDLREIAKHRHTAQWP